jgi:hypothetical protein
MDEVCINAVLEGFAAAGAQVEPGLRDEEFARVETELLLRFPPDLRALLSSGVPVGKGFPDWRRGSTKQLRWLLDGPIDGVVFDVSANSYWRPEWGDRPAEPEKAEARARAELAEVPSLVPVFSHRFMPIEPHEEGNPVFSVSQTDVIVFGNDLAGYLAKEFRIPLPDWSRKSPKWIPFWSDLATA